MREKDVAPLSLGIACAMTPLLAKDDYLRVLAKDDYRPSKKPEVASLDGEIFYRLSKSSTMEGEGKKTRATHARLVDGLEAAARALLNPTNPKPASGGCVVM